METTSNARVGGKLVNAFWDSSKDYGHKFEISTKEAVCDQITTKEKNSILFITGLFDVMKSEIMT